MNQWNSWSNEFTFLKPDVSKIANFSAKITVFRVKNVFFVLILVFGAAKRRFSGILVGIFLRLIENIGICQIASFKI